VVPLHFEHDAKNNPQHVNGGARATPARGDPARAAEPDHAPPCGSCAMRTTALGLPCTCPESATTAAPRAPPSAHRARRARPRVAPLHGAHQSALSRNSTSFPARVAIPLSLFPAIATPATTPRRPHSLSYSMSRFPRGVEFPIFEVWGCDHIFIFDVRDDFRGSRVWSCSTHTSRVANSLTIKELHHHAPAGSGRI
jgi:hypothetical protein